MRTQWFGKTFVNRCVVAGLVLLPLLAHAGTNSWKTAGDGTWETAASWSLLAAPSGTDNTVLITNAASKTVTISASTPAGNLTVSNLIVQAAGGATNTLLLSGNTTPLTCLSAPAGVALSLGDAANQAGALVVNGGSLAISNATCDSITYVGNQGKGVITVSNGTWQANDLYLGYLGTGNGTLNLIGGTNSFSHTNNSIAGKWRVGNAGGATGTVNMTAGVLLTPNATCVIGYNGVGTMTVSNSIWRGYRVQVVGNIGRGTLNLFGGTNHFSSFQIAPGLNTTGSVSTTGGLLIVTNAAGNAQLIVATAGIADMTVSNGTLLVDSTIVGNNAAGGNGTLSLVNSTLSGVAMQVAYYSKGTLYLTGGTNTFSSATPFAVSTWTSGTGTVWMTGGLLVTTNTSANSEAQIGYNTVTPATMTVSNGTWIANNITLGKANGSSGNSLTITRGGQVFCGGFNQNLCVGYTTANPSNNVVLVSDGGLLEFRQVLIYSTGSGNVVSNSGGIYQFALGPYITPGAGSVSINSGTISFRNVATVDVKGNWTGSALTNMTFTGTNAFRLNNSTNNASGQDYTFASIPNTPTNYARLELVNGNTCYRGGNVTLGTGGSVLFSNTTALVTGSLTNNGGTITVVDSTVTIKTNLTLAEGSTINWASNTVTTLITVTGKLTLPTNATFNLTSPIGRYDQVSLFSSTNAIAGSPANWTMSLGSHRLALVGATNLIARPRSPGFVFQVE